MNESRFSSVYVARDAALVERHLMEASWDDLKLFLIVAETGSLSAAAARTGVSAPTVGRRMLALERTMNRLLFERSRRGYELAKDGEILLARVKDMQKISAEITDWHGGAFRDPVIELAGDSWLSSFFACHANSLSKGPGDIRIGVTDFHDLHQLIHRDRVVLLTTTPPTTGNYAILPSVLMRFAAYKHVMLADSVNAPWISLGKEASRLPSDRWVYEHFDRDIYSWTNRPQLVLQLITSGQGRGVLPCFVGDVDERLMREGTLLEDLTVRLYVVVNDDDRRRPEVRLMMNRVSDLLSEHAPLFAGEGKA
ncbi:LysR family transcriptional regulator [uncultured Cohaesibacter sp.]|uniref:helix-turn-helix domain-containing protein n=1 Tax=uncultured Cohaesibacter sp. TaxID=1002546 RepID=UPI002931112E|nr:LysR family transcriptional regulator [uncultured Cohaesibacter sp.]